MVSLWLVIPTALMSDRECPLDSNSSHAFSMHSSTLEINSAGLCSCQLKGCHQQISSYRSQHDCLPGTGVYLSKLDLVRCDRRGGPVKNQEARARCAIVNRSNEDILVIFVGLYNWSLNRPLYATSCAPFLEGLQAFKLVRSARYAVLYYI